MWAVPDRAVASSAVDLRIRETTIGGTPTLAVDGVLDLASVAVFHDALQRFVVNHAGAQVLTIDLDGVVALDDSALGVLLGAAASARDAGGELELVCGAPRLRQRLASTRLDRVLTLRATVG